MTGPAPAVVRTVWDRDQGSCARCGRGLSFEGRGREWSVQHRTARGAGGSKQAWVNQPANLVVLCGDGTTGCHGHVEANRTEAEYAGYTVRRGIHGPAEIPVKHALFGVVFLLDDGNWTTEAP